MSGTPLHIKSIHIHQLHGIKGKDAYSLDGFSKGINIIFGPNASGKSTTASALQEIMWPQSCGDKKRSIDGQLSIAEDGWSARLEPGNIQYLKNGQEDSLPSLGAKELKGKYHLSLHDLLQEGTRNLEFARVISAASQGGFDLPSAAEKLNFDKPIGQKNLLKKKYNSRRSDVRSAREKQNDLGRKAQNLNSLKRKYQSTQQYSEEVKYLRAVLELKAIQNKILITQNELEKFPDQLSLLHGNEKNQLDSFQTKIDKLEERQAQEQSKYDLAVETIKKYPEITGSLDKGDLFKLKGLNQSLKEYEGLLKESERGLIEIKGELDNASKLLGDYFSETQLDDLNCIPIPGLNRLADKVDERNALRESIQLKEAWVEAQSNDFQQDQLNKPHDEALATLSRWLSSNGTSGDSGNKKTNKISWVCIVLAAGVSGTTGYLGIISNSFWWVPFCISILLVFIEWRNTSRQIDRNSRSEKSIHKNYYSSLGFSDPESWNHETIVSLIQNHLELLKKKHQIEEFAKLKKQIEKENEKLTQKEKEVESILLSVRKETGLCIEIDTRWLPYLLEKLSRRQKFHSRLSGKKVSHKEIENRITKIKNELNQIFQRYGEHACDDANESLEKINNLETQFDQFHDALKKKESAQSELSRIDESLSSVIGEKQKLFDRLSIRGGEEGKLESWMNQLSEFKEVKERLSKLNTLAHDRLQTIKRYNRFELNPDELEIEEIEKNIQKLESIIEERENLHREIVGIEKDIERMEQSYNLEHALNNLEDIKMEIESECQKGLKTFVGYEMIQWLKRVTVDRSRPKVFRRANQLIGEFTNHTLALEISDSGDKPEFFARRSSNKEISPIQNLSVGEKVQLLMAVRVAFLEQDENFQLPLILDEALGTSDDLRATKMIKSVIEIAKSGRQIFYFTAQDDEVAKWIQYLDQSGLDFQTFDLESIRSQNLQRVLPRREESKPLNIPKPIGLDHSSYADRIGVPGIDPWDDGGTVHIWYIVDDLEMLYCFLTVGISNLGQFRAYSENQETVIISIEKLERITLKSQILESCINIWKIGRGKPVDKNVLFESGAVSDKFINQLSELVCRCNGDGESVIRCLRDKEVAGWREAKTHDLEEFFIKNNYCSQVPSYSKENARIDLVKRYENQIVNNEMTMNDINWLISHFEWN